MSPRSTYRYGRRRRRGMVVVYLLVMWVALVGFVALAVDFGRVQLVKCQLQNVADAAARAAVFNLPSGAAAAQNAAVAVAAANTADGSPVVINASAVVTGYWNPVAQTFTAEPIAQSNAVQVTASRTAAAGTAVPLLFEGIVGRPTCDVNSIGIACHAENVPLVNPGFETPALGAGQYIYDYPTPGWTLSGSACLVTYGSAWGVAQPDGNQCIALQGNPGANNGVLSQTFPAVAGTYAISFLAARRNSYGIEPITVTVDGTQIELMQPTGNAFATYTTPTFSLTTGSHTVTFAATPVNTDSATFVDDVAVTAVSGTVLLAK